MYPCIIMSCIMLCIITVSCLSCHSFWSFGTGVRPSCCRGELVEVASQVRQGPRMRRDVQWGHSDTEWHWTKPRATETLSQVWNWRRGCVEIVSPMRNQPSSGLSCPSTDWEFQGYQCNDGQMLPPFSHSISCGISGPVRFLALRAFWHIHFYSSVHVQCFSLSLIFQF